MAVTRERVLQLLDSEEPDYRAAAIEAAGDSWDVLEAMVQEADVSIAARAASLVATLAQNPALSSQAVPAIGKAAAHADANVRAVAAFAATRVGPSGDDIVTDLLEDADAGVRRLAFRGLAPPLAPPIAVAVQTLAAGDPDPGVQSAAVSLAVRLPDPALGNELIAGAIEYALRRLDELRALLLNVPSFAAAVGVPGVSRCRRHRRGAAGGGARGARSRGAAPGRQRFHRRRDRAGQGRSRRSSTRRFRSAARR